MSQGKQSPLKVALSFEGKESTTRVGTKDAVGWSRHLGKRKHGAGRGQQS